jgi:hypothetical protein
MSLLRNTLGLFLITTFFASPELKAQCDSWEAHPNGKESAMEMHVNYRRLFEAKKYQEAYEIWKELYAYVKSPKESKTIHFKDGINIYKAFAKAEKDRTKKEEWIDAMMNLYDEMAGCIGEKASDRAREGYNIYASRGSSTKALAMFDKAMELGGNNTPTLVFVPVAQLSVYMFQKKNPTYNADYMRALYDKLKAITTYNVDNKTSKADEYKSKWERVDEEFRKIGDEIWGCDFHEREWKDKFNADKMNMAQNEEILKILKVKCGTDNALYIAVNEVYEPWKQRRDDSIAEANFLSLCNFKKGEYLEKKSIKARKNGEEASADSLKGLAFEWYAKSLDDESTTDCELNDEAKGDLAYRLADDLYRKGSYSEARSLCYQSAKYKPSWGKPYMLIGTMYASSGKRCSGGAGTGWDAQVVAWAAIDMWSKARSIDPSLAEDANSKIARYRKYLPTKGDIFQRGLKENGSYQVGCWINVKTTIRAAAE